MTPNVRGGVVTWYAGVEQVSQGVVDGVGLPQEGGEPPGVVVLCQGRQHRGPRAAMTITPHGVVQEEEEVVKVAASEGTTEQPVPVALLRLHVIPQQSRSVQQRFGWYAS